jgi:hypothetical protein
LPRAEESSRKTIERIEKVIVNPIGRIVQAFAYFGGEDVDYSAVFAQPQAAIGHLLNS